MTCWTASVSVTAGTPSDELRAVLSCLEDSLRRVQDVPCDAASPSGVRGCADALYHYVFDELAPVLHALRIRVRPALQRRGPGRRTRTPEVEVAALLRLGERVALLRPDACAPDSAAAVAGELAGVRGRLVDVAARHLAAQRRVLPVALAGLPRADAERVLVAARRTAAAAAAAPRPDLEPAAL